VVCLRRYHGIGDASYTSNPPFLKGVTVDDSFYEEGTPSGPRLPSSSRSPRSLLKRTVDGISALIGQNIIPVSKVGEIPKTSVLLMVGWALRPDVLRRMLEFAWVNKAVGLNYLQRFGRNITKPSQ